MGCKKHPDHEVLSISLAVIDLSVVKVKKTCPFLKKNCHVRHVNILQWLFFPWLLKHGTT